ncbi:MAG: hypothetical protein ACF8AM_04015, partial [Rhodopirellula sp. JB055]|uniref:hypothetical protein n=1 Tax=Rhodopirellula sp. JB055 TaxID=3342846 RepID=UPI00370B25D3
MTRSSGKGKQRTSGPSKLKMRVDRSGGGGEWLVFFAGYLKKARAQTTQKNNTKQKKKLNTREPG